MQNILEFVTTRSNRTPLYLVAILLFCYLSFTLPLQIWGLPSGFDMVTDMRFASSFQDALADGQVFPGWEDNNLDKGSVGVRFYPPLSIFLLAVTDLATGDWFTAFVLNLSLWMIIGCVGMFFFMKDWMTPGYALFAAITYAIIPQHLADIFQSFLYAQFAAWGLLPFCFMFASRICRGGTWMDSLCLAASYTLLLLTHIPTTIIVSFCLPIYVLFLVDWGLLKKIALQLTAALVLIILATSFRWVILVRELSWLAHNSPEHYGSGYYNFDLWLFPSILGEKSLRLVIEYGWLTDVTTILTALFVIPAVVYLIRRSAKGSERPLLIASLGTAIFAFFMLSRASFYIWDNVVLLQKIQFPTRWLSVFSMFCVVLFSLVVSGAMAKSVAFSRKVIYPALAFVVFISCFSLTQMMIPSDPIPKEEFGAVEAKMATEPQWKGWWPIWAKEDAFANSNRVNAGGRPVEILSWKRESREFTVQPGNAASATVGVFYYPDWKVIVNDHPVEIGKDVNGLIVVPLGENLSKVRLFYQEPLIYSVAILVSALTWLIPILVLAFVTLKKYVLLESFRPALKGEFHYS